ncbi:glycosyl hydrolase [Breoghania sp.]|uniref:glycoside hydrolase family 26 protein n=1 Tax=Breoghania sp. TaxID=2065378 RepID=UPI002AA62B45|nr:glycosyl hydrolase [Breoghania sp.]
MKKLSLLPAILAVLALSALVFAPDMSFAAGNHSSAEPTSSNRPLNMDPMTGSYPGRNVTFGIYDPASAFAGAGDIDIEHMYVFWQALDRRAFKARLSYAESRNRTIMVTVEPYTRAVNWRDGGDHLFRDIVKGKFHREIKTICSELGAFKGDVLVRWGHEMEDANGRYPWARKDAKGYKSAYRHFVKDCRRYVPDASFVWSPKGEKNLADYYPGPETVDLIGLSLYGLEKMDVDYYGGRRDFVSTLREKYVRIARFQQPVIIAELGVSGSRKYRENWFQSLFDTVRTGTREFNLLRSIVYFNDKEPYHWPLGLGSPDWRIVPGSAWFRKAQLSAKN